MQFSLQKLGATFFNVEPKERQKTFFLGLTFFFIIFSYTLIKELKDSIFVGLMGTKDYVPHAKLLTIIALIPLVFIYSKLVDGVRRYQLLCICAAVYSFIGLICAYLLGHGSVGLSNEAAGAGRLFGWIFYFFVESFSPFVLSVFWAFLNSVSSPESAKQNYGLVISFSKVGGMLSAGLGWAFLYYNDVLNSWGFSDIGLIQFLLIVSSVSLLLVPFTIYFMMKKVPGVYLHGYEAAYQFEKQQSKSGKEDTTLWSGLRVLLKHPYTFGIFALVLFFEIVSSVLSFQRLGVAQDFGTGIAKQSCFLLGLAFAVHCVGFFISFLGTRVIVSKLGERFSLVLIPVTIGGVLIYYTMTTSAVALLICFVVMRAVHYALNQPITEALYIPTVKAVKFKSKSWIDTFGKKMAKGVGSVFNGISSAFGPALFQTVHAALFGLIIGLWMVVAYLLGKKFEQAVKNHEVIGAEDEE